VSSERTERWWAKWAGQLIVAAIAASGVSIGTRQYDMSELSSVRQELRSHEDNDKSIHDSLSLLLAVDNGGFCDSRIFHAVAEQISKAIEPLQTRESARIWRLRFQQLNRDLTLPAGD
jgi:hypothetical protein